MNDTSALIDDLAKTIGFSKMFGCKTEHQARIFAYTCVYRRIDPLVLQERYHIIGDSDLGMKSEAMLAGFCYLGGEYRIIQADGDACEIEFQYKGKHAVRIAWEDIKDESWTKTKEGEVKQNYRTAFSRADMLWARVVSRGIRRMAPEVLVGRYAPEEIADHRDLPKLEESERSAPVAEQVAAAPPEAKPQKSPPVEEPAVTPVTSSNTANEETLIELHKLCKELEASIEDQRGILTKFGVETWNQLKQADAERILGKLRSMAQLKRNEQQAPAQEQASPADQTPQLINRETLDGVTACAAALKMPPSAVADVLAKRGVHSWAELTQAQGEEILSRMNAKCNEIGISPFAGTLDDAVDADLVQEIRTLINSVSQADPHAVRKVQEKLAACGLSRINELTVAEGRLLRDALQLKEMDQFFAASLEGWAKKASGTAAQQS